MDSISYHGGIRVLPAAEIKSLKRKFHIRNAVFLSRILAPSLLRSIQKMLENECFADHTAAGISHYNILDNPFLNTSLSLLFSSEEVFAWVRTITERPDISSFHGFVYNMEPGTDHYFDWHSDNISRRAAALSVVLGERPFNGGRLQIRASRPPRAICWQSPRMTAGDAVLFRISPQLEHSNTPLSGKTAKRAYSGFFSAEKAEYRIW